MHKGRAHALLSASGASRWLACTPSARLEDRLPEQSSEFAREGTLAHEIADLKLQDYRRETPAAYFSALLTEKRTEQLYDPEMEKHADNYVDYVTEVFTEAQRADPHGAVMLPEVRVDFSEWVPDGFGTCDATVIGGTVIDVIDFKYGQGVPVSAHDNPQLKLYGLGALQGVSFMFPELETVRLHVYQPRLYSISVYELSVDELLEWGEQFVKPTAAKAYAGEGEQVPGDYCRFCKIQPTCRALAEQAKVVAAKDFADPKELTDDELLEVFEMSDRLTKYLGSVSKHITDSAKEGKSWPGYKLVAGRARRLIADEDKAIKRLRAAKFKQADYMQRNLLGILALEKLVGKAEFSKVLGDAVVKPEGAPTLVPESDKRPAINHKSDFD